MSIFSSFLSSYNKDGGVSMLKKWVFDQSIEENEISDIMEAIYSSCIDQSTAYIQKIPVTTLEIPSLNYHITNSFITQSSDNNIIYAFSLFVSKQAIDERPYIADIIAETTSSIVLYIMTLIKAQKPINNANEYINSMITNVKDLFSIYLGQQEIMAIPKGMNEFYALVLSSHLSTQMTTVIEASSIEEANPLISLLSHFLLPYQRELSSSVIRSSPLPGLYLQVISPQKSFPAEILALFPRQWTFVSFKNKAVRQSPDWEAQRQARAQIRHVTLQIIPGGQSDASKKLSLTLAKYRCKYWETIPPQILRLINQISKLSSEAAAAVCEMYLNEVLHTALTVIKTSDALMQEKQQYFLGPENVQQMNRALGIDDEELRMAVGVASAFDQKISATVYTGCQAVIKKMLNAV